MDTLQKKMEANAHLKHPKDVEEHIQTVSKFWPALSEEDRDYIDGCRHAIEEQISWTK